MYNEAVLSRILIYGVLPALCSMLLATHTARAHTLPISTLTLVPDENYLHLELILNPFELTFFSELDANHDGRFDPDGVWDGADAESISKIAIVGEPAWKVVRPDTDRHQQIPIEYFATEQAARRWLAERCVPSGWRPVTDTRGVRRRRISR